MPSVGVVFPLSVIAPTVGPCKHPRSILLVLSPRPRVLAQIRPDVRAAAVLHVIKPLAVVGPGDLGYEFAVAAFLVLLESALVLQSRLSVA